MDKFFLINVGATSISFFVSYILCLNNLNIWGALVLCVLSLSLFFYYFKNTGSIINLRGLFCLFWIMTIALSSLRIHPLQKMWKSETWVILWLSCASFLLGYETSPKLRLKGLKIRKITKLHLLYCLFVIISLAFIFEIFYLGYLPVFSSEMGAYQDFHVFLLHYLTVSCVLFLPITIVYVKNNKTTFYQRITLMVMNLVMFSVPILIVSRRYLLMNIMLSAFTFLKTFKYDRKIKLGYLLKLGIVLALGWLAVSLLRNQDNNYLHEVLMLDNKLPVEMYVPYLYVTFNIDNFDCIVGTITQYKYGYESLFSIWGLTRLKYLWPTHITEVAVEETLIPVYNTYSFLKTPYMDGGIAGVFIYCLVFGMIAGTVERYNRRHNDCLFLIQTLLAYCIVFCFFSAFLSSLETLVFFCILLFFSIPVRRVGTCNQG